MALSVVEQIRLATLGRVKMPQILFVLPAGTTVNISVLVPDGWIFYLTGFSFADTIPAYDFDADAGVKFSYIIDEGVIREGPTYLTSDLIDKHIPYGWIPINRVMTLIIESTLAGNIWYAQTAHFYYGFKKFVKPIVDGLLARAKEIAYMTPEKVKVIVG